MIGRVNGSHSARRSPSLHRRAVLVQQHGAVGHAVDRPLAAFGVDHHDLAVAGEAEAPAALVDDGRHVAVVDGAVGDRLEVRLVSLTCAAPPMWKVRIVSWVPGSPIDCAAMTPTASPMLTGVPRARSRP